MKGYLLATMLLTSSVSYADTTPQPETDVIVVTATYCGACKRIKSWFKSNGITYTEYDAYSKIGDKLYRQYKGVGVPLTIINGVKVTGLDAVKIQHLVNEKRLINELPFN